MLQGVPNCRDMGGLVTESGKSIRPNMLIRSAHLVNATPQDTDELTREHRLSMVIDLRTDFGITREPDVRIPGVTYVHAPIFDDSVLGITHDNDKDADLQGYKSALNVPPMEDLYRMMVLQEDCRENLGHIMRTIMEHDYETGSVLWHCSEGKDRCGLVSALVLAALRVNAHTIMEDYLLTNLVNKAKAQKYYEEVLAETGSEVIASTIEQAFLAKESYLVAAFGAILESYGPIETYMEQGLGVSLNTIESFRIHVL